MVEIETQPQPVVAVLKYQAIDLSVCSLFSWSGSLSAHTLTTPPTRRERVVIIQGPLMRTD